jgi:hypothetical protein
MPALTTTCPVGSYASSNATSCTGCEAGHFCYSTSGTRGQCPDGSYSLDNWAFDVVCPAGHNCIDIASILMECDFGTSSLGGQSFCSPCSDLSCRLSRWSRMPRYHRHAHHVCVVTAPTQHLAMASAVNAHLVSSVQAMPPPARNAQQATNVKPLPPFPV